MKIALLGIGHFHSPIYVGGVQELGHTVSGLHEDDPEIAAIKADKLGMPVSTSAEAMLDAEHPDFAVVMGSPRQMPELLRFVIERGIPFLVEKPAARTSEELRPLAELASQRGLWNAVAFSMRWHPAVRLCGEWLRNGRLGRPGWFKLEYFGGPVSRYPAMHSPWMNRREETGGGCLLNLGIHALDALRFWGLHPAVSGGFTARPWQQADYEDLSSVWLSCGAAAASVECGYAGVSPGRGFCFEIMADRGHASMTKGHLVFTATDKTREEHSFADGDYRREMLTDLLALHQAGVPSPTPVTEAVAGLELIDAFYRRRDASLENF